MQHRTRTTLAAIIAPVALMSSLTAPAEAAPTVPEKGLLCSIWWTCNKAQHADKGLDEQIRVTCGTYENPGKEIKLHKAEWTTDAGNCGKHWDAYWVPKGREVWELADNGQTWKVGDKTGWRYVKHGVQRLFLKKD